MKKICYEIQEKLLLGETLAQEHCLHFKECPTCQENFADFQTFDSAIRSFSDLEIPENFADQVMAKIYQEVQSEDWFESLLIKVQRWSSNKVFEYGYLSAGVGLGVLSFIRFVLFIFIPAG